MNLYNISARFQFSETLVDKILEISKQNLFSLSEFTILLPSRKACKNLKEAFLKKNNGKPMLLPTMFPLGEVDEEELSFDNLISEEFFEFDQAISYTEQKMILATIIHKYNPEKNLAESINLAIELGSFLADLQKEKIEIDKLNNIFPEDLADHWQKIMKFLQIISIEWPEILKEKNLLDAIIRRNSIIERRAEVWKLNPPKYPIIAAGSTGSLPSTAILLKVIMNLPEGKVILPALDKDLDDLSWNNINEFHPQFTLRTLLKFLEVKREDVIEWIPNDKKEIVTYSRSVFLSDIMRPAISSEKWLKLRQLDIGTLKNMSWVSCDNLQEEANVIAMILRESLEIKDKTSALITSDKELARRVSLLVKRWNINIDYSEGDKLSDTPLGVYLRLIVEMSKSNFSAISVLAVLKHPLTNLGFDREKLRELLMQLEVKAFRGIKPELSLESIKEFLITQNFGQLIELIDKLKFITTDFTALFKQKSVRFIEMFEKHLELAEKLAFSDESTNIWNSSYGSQLSSFFTEIRLYGNILGNIRPQEYFQIFNNLMIGQSYRKPYDAHPRLAILTPIEARMHNYDMLILGGLNEGVWPNFPESGPWISRAMRKNIGLSIPEKRIGQAAHDFYSLAHAKEVIMTRSIKIDNTLTVASRWLQRIEAVLRNVGIKTDNFNQRPWKEWVNLLNKPDAIISIKSPEPKPEICFRPTNFSVTQIEKLVRNPYGIYASDILKLRRIDEIDSEPNPADFGNFVHKALEYYLNYSKESDESEYQALIKCGVKAIGKLYDKAYIRNIWWPKFERIAKWFTENYKMSNNKIYSEVRGKYEFIIGDKNFILNTKADRIEIDEQNNVSIIDYKTGNVPERSSIIKGISSQMILEALIAKKGGYFCQAKNLNYNIDKLIYLGLSGNEQPGILKLIDEDLDKLIDEASRGLKNLFEIFMNKEVPYLYCPNPALSPRYNEYEHLARSKEWIE